MEVVPFKTKHFAELNVQPAQAHLLAYVNADSLKPLENMNSFSCIEDNKVWSCFGWMEIYPTRAVAWSFMDKDAGQHFVALTRVAKRMFDAMPHRRIEMEVDCEFEQGHRWATMLGFTQEAERLRGYRVDGGDVSIYARIK